MQQAVIRAAGVSDLEEVIGLLRDLHPDEAAPDPAKAQAAWSAMLGSGLVTLLVAEIGGCLASSCTVAIVPNLTHAARPFGIIENVVTRSDYRRQGLGHAVLAAALEVAYRRDLEAPHLKSSFAACEAGAFIEPQSFRPL